MQMLMTILLTFCSVICAESMLPAVDNVIFNVYYLQLQVLDGEFLSTVSMFKNSSLQQSKAHDQKT